MLPGGAELVVHRTALELKVIFVCLFVCLFFHLQKKLDILSSVFPALGEEFCICSG